MRDRVDPSHLFWDSECPPCTQRFVDTTVQIHRMAFVSVHSDNGRVRRGGLRYTADTRIMRAAGPRIRILPRAIGYGSVEGLSCDIYARHCYGRPLNMDNCCNCRAVASHCGEMIDSIFVQREEKGGGKIRAAHLLGKDICMASSRRIARRQQCPSRLMFAERSLR